jgi:hypothetical protein
MASVWLKRRGWQDGDVPDVCMKCGRKAYDRVQKTFLWMPGWVYVLILAGLLIFAIVALCVRERRTTSLPLCEEHKNHWYWRNLWAGLSFLLVVALSFLAGGWPP